MFYADWQALDDNNPTVVVKMKHNYDLPAPKAIANTFKDECLVSGLIMQISSLG